MYRKLLALTLALGCLCFFAAADEHVDYLLGGWTLTPHFEYEIDHQEMEVDESPYFDEPAFFEFASALSVVIRDSVGSEMSGSWEILETGDLGAVLLLSMEGGEQELRLVYTRVNDTLSLFAMHEADMGTDGTIASGLMERAGGQ